MKNHKKKFPNNVSILFDNIYFLEQQQNGDVNPMVLNNDNNGAAGSGELILAAEREDELSLIPSNISVKELISFNNEWNGGTNYPTSLLTQLCKCQRFCSIMKILMIKSPREKLF